jgi:cytochrome oxidase Cu insertion factor (SCO1/SenC/PrrC family)
MKAPRRVVFALLPALAVAASAHERPAPVAIPPAGAFGPPRPGSYALPPIPLAARGTVVDEAGHAHELAALLRGRITLLGLVYTHCTDPDGCPRATWAFSKVREILHGDASLRRRAQLLTLSFDPANDTPRAMAQYAAQVRGDGAEAHWRFLTTRSPAAIAPILRGLDQDVTALPGSAEAFEHTVKVYLFDERGRVREIYSSAYLWPEMIVNDMRTLDLERRHSAASASGGQVQKRLRSP